MNGIDISNYQSGISLAAVKPGFVIAKISEGTNFRDKAFDSFYNECKALGIPVGAYVYSHSTGAGQGGKEAEYALSILAGRKLDLPIYLDIEGDILNAGKIALTSSAIAFADMVQAKGYKAGVYASLSTFRDCIDTDALRARGVSIWLAHWGVSAPGIPCDVWQINVGHVNGYKGEIDLDVSYMAIDPATATPAVENTAPAVQPATQTLYPASMAVLCRGFYGSQVALMQKLLGISADGIFGAETESAVRLFQQKNGLIADGIAGEQTFKKLVK